MKNKFGVFVGRFQPLHSGHMIIINKALEECENLIVFVGSSKTSRTIKNPFTFEERKTMIENAVLQEQRNRLMVVPIRDYFYIENGWMKEMQRMVAAITNGSKAITLYGHFKDDTSDYLNWFPQWKLRSISKTVNLDATMIRTLLFSSFELFPTLGNVPPSVTQIIRDFVGTEEYRALVEEYTDIQAYRKSWESAPFPPMFVTTDAIVVQSGHVLVVQRKFNPGKGRYALPGGFLNPKEFIVDGALRELKEETRIDLPKDLLKKAITKTKTFDYPYRSERGRTITHGHFIQLDDNRPLPKVVPADDAEKAFWMPLAEVEDNAERFFEDHVHIIRYFVQGM